MPFSIEEVESHFKELGFKVIVPDDVEHRKIGRALRFSTKRYVDFEGDKSVLISLIVDPDGEYLELVAPRVYNVRECPHKGAVFAALLEIAYKTRKQNFEYNPADGEIRVAADMPIEDGTATVRQLDALLGAIIAVLEQFHPVIKHVIETGRLDLSLADEPEVPDTSNDPVTAELIAKLGGIDGLRKLVEERGGTAS